jgi:hypothetical protein
MHSRLPLCFPVLKLSLHPLLQSRPPINSNAADGCEVSVLSSRLSTAADLNRYAASPRRGRYLEVAYGASIHLPLPEILELLAPRLIGAGSLSLCAAG